MIAKQVFLCLLICLGVNNMLTAQDGEANPPAPKAKKVKAAKKGNSMAAIIVQVSGMTREEKNTMSNCPLHSKRMTLSDNYRADASDYTPGDEYPFAYQLNYRRYCTVCTRVMSKEAKMIAIEDENINKGKGTFERCGLHNSPLKGNTLQDKVDYEKNPSADMPHAKQYLFKNYCTVCTKIYKIQNK